jgi:hypothetical protein
MPAVPPESGFSVAARRIVTLDALIVSYGFQLARNRQVLFRGTYNLETGGELHWTSITNKPCTARARGSSPLRTQRSVGRQRLMMQMLYIRDGRDC